MTFLMVFLIQRAQNKVARATPSKLSELSAALESASNRLIDVESFSEAALETIHRHYQRLASMAKRDSSITRSHSILEAEVRHRRKTVPAHNGTSSPRPARPRPAAANRRTYAGRSVNETSS